VDIEALRSRALDAGNVAIPFVEQLTAQAERMNADAARVIHLGATSQDVLDTALVLQMREGVRLLLIAMDRLDVALAAQVRLHAVTVLTGRTWLQPGPPTTLGLKLAGTLTALRRHRERIESAAKRALVLQFGGAVGTLAALGAAGGAVSAELALILELKEPELPWHTQRDNVVEVGEVLALLVGSLGKFARDIALLMQAEVGEAAEPAKEGRGGSSTMPQKQNPVASATILACAARTPGLVATLLNAMPQEHERGLGLWQAEWETLPELFRLAAAALARAIEIAEGLVVDAARMESNLEARLGLAQAEAVSVALAGAMPRSMAHGLVRIAAREAAGTGQQLSSVLKTMPEVTEHLAPAEIDRLLNPAEYLGSAQRFIKRALGEDDGKRNG
jgi:3-carboxy-cis,cis-muconate cycloisomerase